MPNRNKIKGRIVEKGKTIQEIAREMKLTPYILGQKIAGKTNMSLDEANKLQQILEIADEEFRAYFFAS